MSRNQVVFPPKDLKGLVISLVALVVLGSLGYWWYTSELPFASWTSRGTESAQDNPSESGSTATTPGGQAKPSAVQGKRDVVSIIASLPSVSSFRSYFSSTGVGATIGAQSVSPYTVFVPTNTAIARLTKGTISGLSGPEQARLVKYHVVSGKEIDADALVSGQVTSLSGDVLNFTIGSDGVARVNSAAVIGTYKGTNGIVYVIDGVLLPPKKQF